MTDRSDQVQVKGILEVANLARKRESYELDFQLVLPQL
jgi:hypothetical protein